MLDIATFGLRVSQRPGELMSLGQRVRCLRCLGRVSETTQEATRQGGKRAKTWTCVVDGGACADCFRSRHIFGSLESAGGARDCPTQGDCSAQARRAAARGFASEEGEFKAHIGACIKARRETGQCAKDFA